MSNAERRGGGAGRAAWVASVGGAVLLTMLLAVGLAIFSRYGAGWIGRAQEAEATTVLREGIRLQAGGDVDAAIAAYRRALDLGIDWAPSRENCVQRLQWLVASRGHLDGPQPRDDENVLGDGGLEEVASGDGPWEVCDGAAVSRLEFVEGRAALRCPLATEAKDLLRQTVAVEPGKSYRASYWMRVEEATDPAVKFYVMRHEEVLAESDTVRETRDWRQEEVYFTAPEIVENEVLDIALLFKGSGAGGFVWVDDVVLAGMDSSLLANGSFERGDDGRRFWLGNLPDTVTCSLDSTVRVEGRHSLRFDVAEGGSFAIRQEIPVAPGESYALSGWVRAEGAGAAFPFVEVTDAEDASALAIPAVNVTPDQGWVQCEIAFGATDHTRTLRVVLQRPAAEGAAGTVWFDAWSLRPML